MYSKLLLSQSVKTSGRLLSQSRPASQVVTLSRNFSIFHKDERNYLSTPYVLKNQSNFFVRFQSTVNADNIAAASAENVKTISSESSHWVSEAGEVLAIPDPPIPIVQEVVTALSANGEPTFSSLGLCNYTPVGALQYIFEWIHVTYDIPWWGTIAMCTVALRTLLFPVFIKCQRTAVEMKKQMPEVQYLTDKMTEARQEGDMYQASLYADELMRFTKEKKYNPLKAALMPIVQAPIFISMFYGLRSMSDKVPSLKEGGTLWFTDLTVCDPYYLMPVLTSATLLLTIEIGTDSVAAQGLPKGMRWAIRSMPFIIFPFIMNFQGAILVYWLTNNFVSLVQTGFLRIPAVRQYFRIAASAPPPPKMETKPKKGFKRGFEDTIQNFKIAREMRERENFNAMQFRQAGKGPLTATYSFNPKKQGFGSTELKKRSVQ